MIALLFRVRHVLPDGLGHARYLQLYHVVTKERKKALKCR